MFIDWTVFDGDPEREVRCECGRVFYTHVKGVWIEGDYRYLSRRDCPKCGRNNAIRRVAPSEDVMVVKSATLESIALTPEEV